MFEAPLQSRIERPAKSSPVLSRWHNADGSQGTRNTWRKRGQDDTGSRLAPRMTAASMSAGSQRRAHPAMHKSLLVHRDGHHIPVPARSGFYVGPGGVLHSMDDSENEEEHDIDELREGQRDASAEVARRHASASVNPAGRARRLDSQTATKHASSAKAARQLNRSEDLVEISDTSSESHSDSEQNDYEQLMVALDALSLSTARLKEYKKLPFLMRNLRKGFLHRCQLVDIPTAPRAPPKAPVSVLYRYDASNDSRSIGFEDEEIQNEPDYEEREGRMLEWDCPLCQLHGHFDTREMLEFHLKRDHREVEVNWTGVEGRNGDQSLRLIMTVPDIEDDDTDDEDAESSEESNVGREGRPPSEPVEEVEPISIPVPPPASEEVPLRGSPAGSDEIIILSPRPRAATPPLNNLIPKKFRAYSPTPTQSTSTDTQPRPSTDTQSRSSTVHVRRRVAPRGYPTPPPESDPLGPVAQYPYLPDPSEGGEVFYSCRIGGPRIYDLLNTLSLEPFGILSWQIVDREEELFEIDDIRDEDKVILALWNRWIMLNRTAFILGDYCEKIKDFVDEYWRMIHRAAGWRALRGFLIMLVTNRYLKLPEVIQILKHYESHTGMDKWYKDDDDDDAANTEERSVNPSPP